MLNNMIKVIGKAALGKEFYEVVAEYEFGQPELLFSTRCLAEAKAVAKESVNPNWNVKINKYITSKI